MKQAQEIRINLLNYKLESASARRRAILEWVTFFVVAIILLGTILGLSIEKRHESAQIQKENQQLLSKLNLLNAQTTSQMTITQIEEQVRTREKLVNEVINAKHSFGKVLEELGTLNISGTRITKLDLVPGRAVLKGSSNEKRSIVSLLAWISNEKFGDISNLNYSADEASGTITFTIMVNLEEHTQ